MPAYVALLRAVNLGPHDKVSSNSLKAIGDALGFARARTFIASGNLLFDTDADEPTVKAALEQRVAEHVGKAIPVMVRTGTEMASIRDANPFIGAPGNRVMAVLLDASPPPDALAHARHVNGEQMALSTREIYIRYTDTGMGTSKLVIPAAKTGTARNMNTVAKLADLLA